MPKSPPEKRVQRSQREQPHLSVKQRRRLRIERATKKAAKTKATTLGLILIACVVLAGCRSGPSCESYELDNQRLSRDIAALQKANAALSRDNAFWKVEEKKDAAEIDRLFEVAKQCEAENKRLRELNRELTGKQPVPPPADKPDAKPDKPGKKPTRPIEPRWKRPNPPPCRCD